MANEEKSDRDALSTAEDQAISYDRVVKNRVKQDRPYSHLIDLITIAEGSIVLDLGCGTGYLSSFLAELVGPSGHVIAVDPDRQRIRVAKANVKVANITFLVADGETFPEQEYDAVFCNAVMGSIENKLPVFNRVRKLLRPGGQFVLGVYLGLHPIFDEMSRLMGPEGEKKINAMWHHVPAEVFVELAKSSGFVVTKKEEDKIVYSYPNIDGVLENWYAATHGKFDPTLADPQKLKEFKDKFAGQEIVKKLPYGRFVLTKI